MGASAVLTLQDAVEMFLLLACEHLNAGVDERTNFEKYFVLADAVLTGQGRSALSGKASMMRLNKARVGLKHYGNYPAVEQLEDFRSATASFLEDNTRLVFDVEFNAISMVDLVTCKEAQQSLREAEALVRQSNYPDAIGKIALAYHQLIQDYERTKLKHGYRSAFQFSESFRFVRGRHLVSSVGVKEREFERFVDNVATSIDALADAVRVLSFGLDYRRFARFDALTPRVWHVLGGMTNVAPPSIPGTTEEECRFCFDFVIDAAIRLQEFEFELGSLSSPPAPAGATASAPQES